ncbi:MAG: hypothetical protein AVDCRST_MAG74-2303 [uncultured Pyrinomonadaceae bacterium]|uniref:Peptidase M15B domain-containing protein n=1 Tax=uncultured Pyrinomonadaceae bacterium TaxID=2283094 RepID=A0A6J4PBN3_9BACT|nr:MAG: hypothetical protein AVDCRST_MAG74-2303 [uncultured Pyrinomonadaceae bacterium]
MFKTIKAFILIFCFGAFLQSVNADGNLKFTDYNESKTSSVVFRSSLEMSLARRGLKSADFCDENDAVSRRVLKDYGAIFLADDKNLLLPPVCIFASEVSVTDFQKQMRIARARIGDAEIELQSEAMNALLAARREAITAGLNITPRDGAEAARRDYSDTLRLWNSRFFPALEHWRRLGKLTRSDAERLSSLSTQAQIEAVLELEERGVFFSKDFSKSILYSVAAPGASQHLSLLAFDANEYEHEKVRRILARHGWFRTVKNDSPHFTFLGVREKDLPARGLRKLESFGGEFWIPNMQ